MWHITEIREMQTGFLWEKSEGKRQSVRISLDEKIILMWILNRG
jgi:hypothetical protein